MNFKTFAACAAGAAVTLMASQGAFAQAPAAAAAPAIPQGPPINGLCVFSEEQVIATSAVGKNVLTRLQQIGQQANAELTTERAGLQNEAKQLDTQRTTLDQNTLERRAADLQVRDNAWQRKAQQRQAEMDETQKQALGRVYTEMEPLVRQAYQQKGCSVLLSRQAVIMPPNPAMDITPQVVTALNAKIQTLQFDRVRLDQPAPTAQAGPAPTAVRPVAPAPVAPARK
jgi:outer membrane protein